MLIIKEPKVKSHYSNIIIENYATYKVYTNWEQYNRYFKNFCRDLYEPITVTFVKYPKIQSKHTNLDYNGRINISLNNRQYYISYPIYNIEFWLKLSLREVLHTIKELFEEVFYLKQIK